jgi:hypothetical protein
MDYKDLMKPKNIPAFLWAMMNGLIGLFLFIVIYVLILSAIPMSLAYGVVGFILPLLLIAGIPVSFLVPSVMTVKYVRNSEKPKISVIIVTVLMAIPVLYVMGSFAYMVENSHRKNVHGYQLLSEINPQELVADCRMMIANRNKYKNDNIGELDFREDETVLSSEKGSIGTNIPLSIRKLEPSYILICTNYIKIGLPAPLHTKIVGFPEGVEGYGAEKLTNGLWRWGLPHSK